MGQRSQIYVRYSEQGMNDFGAMTKLVPLYFQWNYAERMISRCRLLIDWLIEHFDYKEYEYRKIQRVAEFNYDLQDVMESENIIETIKRQISPLNDDDKINNFVGLLFNMANNDGKLLIDVVNNEDGKTCTIKYAFLDYDNCYLGDASAYMRWDCRGWTKKDGTLDVATTRKNIKRIKEQATLMTEQEADEFITADYMYLIKK